MPSTVVQDRRIREVLQSFDAEEEGGRAYRLIETLFPICRSITGDGLRRSLRMIGETVPLDIREVPSGTEVFDWTVPKEWNIREAWIKDSHGEKVVDFAKSNLHVVNYSLPVHRWMTLEELRPHLHTLPDSPDWIPYRTSYYREDWGFCVSQRQLDAMEEGDYEVRIDSTLEAGHLSYGEYRVQGETDDEVLVSCHACHPSLANDNLSGMAVAVGLARLLTGVRLRFSYRFLWIPGTIGSITWLATHEALLPRIRHGLVLSCLGDPGAFTYKQSRHAAAEVDRAVQHVLRHSGKRYEILEFSPHGYDERQYCSPGINLEVGCLMRTPNGRYPEYHTSADDLDFIKRFALGESLKQLLQIVQVLEGNGHYLTLNPKCEPQLGRRGLYRQMGGTNSSGFEQAMLWILNFSDGEHSLLDIAERSDSVFSDLSEVADVLFRNRLLQPIRRCTKNSP